MVVIDNMNGRWCFGWVCESVIRVVRILFEAFVLLTPIQFYAKSGYCTDPASQNAQLKGTEFELGWLLDNGYHPYFKRDGLIEFRSSGPKAPADIFLNDYSDSDARFRLRQIMQSLKEQTWRPEMTSQTSAPALTARAETAVTPPAAAPATVETLRGVELQPTTAAVGGRFFSPPSNGAETIATTPDQTCSAAPPRRMPGKPAAALYTPPRRR